MNEQIKNLDLQELQARVEETDLSPEGVEKLAAKFDIAPHVDLDKDSHNIAGLRIKDFGNPKEGRVLDVASFANEGLVEGTYARNGNNIVFRKGEQVLFMTDTSASDVSKKLEESGFKKVEGVGIPSLGDPELYYAGANDSTFRSIQGNF